MISEWVHTSLSQQVTVGPAALRAAPEVLRALGARRVLLVTTRGRVDSDVGEAVRRGLGRVLAATFDQVEPNVPAPVVQAAVRTLRSESIDAVVSLGGGAAIDTAKALAFFHEHESGTPAAGFADRPLLPHLAIPTTLVGAAFTPTFSMVDPHTRRSTSTGAATLAPAAVLVDAELGADLPVEVLRGSVAAALAHGVEALWAPDRDPEVEAVAAAGLRRVAGSAAAAVAEPGDVERRAPLVDGAVLVGRARQQVADGLQHVLAQLLAVRTGAPYGAVHAALLPVTIRFTVEAAPEAGTAIATALGEPHGDPAELMASLLARLDAPTGLEALGVTDDDLDAAARQAGAQRGVQTHPRPVGEADVRALLDDAW
jgi:maleylacetate reductase